MYEPPRSIRFPLACALANAGAVVGYLPLLSVLLPLKVAMVAGDGRYALLAEISIVGALAAGGGNLAAGWASDVTRRRMSAGGAGGRARGGRREWIAGGLLATLAMLAALPLAHTPAALIVAVGAFQVALNLWLAPMAALVAEEVPPARLGLTTGLFAAGPPIASLLTLGFAGNAFASEPARLALVGAVMIGCVLPLVLSRAGGRGGGTGEGPSTAPQPTSRRDLAIAWTARLLIQIAGNVVFVDLVYLLNDGVAAGAVSMMRTGSLLFLANLLPLPVAVMLGRWSDRHRRRRGVLVATAMLAATGLAAMAAAPDHAVRAGGFLAFSTGWGAFLALQVGTIIRLLPAPDHLGRDLSIVNLANTLPVIVGQSLTAAIITPGRPGALLAALAVLTAVAGLTMATLSDQRR